jgi:hypothetical protein
MKQGDMLCVCHEQEQLGRIGGAVQSRGELKQFVFKKRVESPPRKQYFSKGKDGKCFLLS